LRREVQLPFSREHFVKTILIVLLFVVIAFTLVLLDVFKVLPISFGFFDNGRERRARARGNVHSVQLALEDFAIHTHGVYPTDSTSATSGGLTLRDMFPGGEYPENPFTGRPVVIHWNSDPVGPGEIGINPADSFFYTVKGSDAFGVMPLELSPGI
jgi:hypothetical protein